MEDVKFGCVQEQVEAVSGLWVENMAAPLLKAKAERFFVQN